MKTIGVILKISAVCILGIATALWLRFGSPSPCGALKSHIKRAAFEQLAASPESGSARLVVGTTFGGQVLDAAVDSLSPIECLQKLANGSANSYQADVSGG